MTKLKCLLKVSDNAEPYFTYFNLSTGMLVDNFEWVSPVDLVGMFDYDPGQSVVDTDHRDVLYNIMLKYVNGRLLIRGAGGEHIFALSTRIAKYKDTGFMAPYFECSGDFIKLQFTETGRVLSPCLTFDVMHPAFKLTVCTVHDRIYLMTRCGLRDITDTHEDILQADDSVRITPAMLLDCGRPVYGGYSVDGEIKYID